MVAHVELFRRYEWLEGKKICPSILRITPTRSLKLDKEVKRPGAIVTEAGKEKYNKYRGTLPRIYTLLPLAVSMYGTMGSDK